LRRAADGGDRGLGLDAAEVLAAPAALVQQLVDAGVHVVVLATCAR
jgi:hypothetical protein